MKRVLIGVVVLVCVLVAGDPQRAFAQDCDAGTFAGAFAGEVVVQQNWNCRERQEFRFTDQGSQIIPYAWFLHLEQVGSTAKFADPANMDRYRYLPQKPTELNPDGLPIGFTKGTAEANEDYSDISRNWLGLTCAACHTGQIEFDGAKYLIDGAPAMADFESMFLDLADAMKATLDDNSKFERFAAAVIADSEARDNGGTSDRDQLRVQFKVMTDIRDDWNRLNAGKSRYGHARLDALGAIFNAVAATALNNPSNRQPADAPVSYPFIWDTPQHDKVQWNGSVPNAGPGALARNAGEVLGVFGALDLNLSRLSRSGHNNSVNVRNLGKLEELVVKMWSPKWSETTLPPIDTDLADKGRLVFDRLCKSCHADIDRTDPKRRVTAVMIPVSTPDEPDDPDALGTDPLMATNFVTRRSQSGRARKMFKRYWAFLSKGERLGDPALNANLLGFAVFGAITRRFFDDPFGTIDALKAGQPPAIVAVLEQAKRHLSGEADPRTGKVKKEEIVKVLREILQATEAYRDQQRTEKQALGDDSILDKVEKVRERLRRSDMRIEGVFIDREDEREDACPLCYKARPLNGIWATAPYLHNGSVRTMRQLLLPADQREKSFKVGTREFDPDDIGFKDEGAFTLDTSLRGNSNAGHDGPIYGSEVLAADPEKMKALLEYLKTL